MKAARITSYNVCYTKLLRGLSNSAFGSDNNYIVYDLSYNGYQAFGERHTLAWRLAGKYVTGVV